MRYLGVDYGKRKIGLAVSEGQVATPLKVLDVSSLDEAVDKVRGLLKREEVGELVVGVPESGEALNLVKSFINRICKYVKVVEVEETLSSQDALNLMIESGVKRMDRRKEDAYSATIILQDYLDSQKK